MHTPSDVCVFSFLGHVSQIKDATAHQARDRRRSLVCRVTCLTRRTQHRGVRRAHAHTLHAKYVYIAMPTQLKVLYLVMTVLT